MKFQGRDYMGLSPKIVVVIDDEDRCQPLTESYTAWGLNGALLGCRNLAQAILERVDRQAAAHLVDLYAHDVVRGWPVAYFKTDSDEVQSWIENHKDLILQASE